MEKYRFLRRLPQSLPRGFTLIEMMVTVALMVILGMMAVPALQGFLTRTSMRSLQNDFVGAMQRARGEAMARNTCVSMCQLVDGSTTNCETDEAKDGQWHKGWILFENPACQSPTATPFSPPAASIIQVRVPGNARFTLEDKSASSDRNYFTYNSRGMLMNQNATMALRDTQDALGALSPNARYLIVSTQGRVRVDVVDPSSTATAAGN